MTYTDDMILSAILRANKAGARGQEVVGICCPASASSDPVISLIVRIPEPRDTTELPWHAE